MNLKKKNDHSIYKWLKLLLTIIFFLAIIVLSGSAILKQPPLQTAKMYIDKIKSIKIFDGPSKKDLIIMLNAEKKQHLSLKKDFEAWKKHYGLGLYSVVINEKELNIRKRPFKTADVLFKIPNGEKVEVIYTDDLEDSIDNISGNWCKIKYKTQTGWAFGIYLQKI